MALTHLSPPTHLADHRRRDDACQPENQCDMSATRPPEPSTLESDAGALIGALVYCHQLLDHLQRCNLEPGFDTKDLPVGLSERLLILAGLVGNLNMRLHAIGEHIGQL